MTFTVTVSPSAARQLRKLEPAPRRRIQAVIETLAENPRPPGAIRLVGSSDWRVRTGDYRVVYSIDDGVLVVLVVAVGHRREIYDR